MLRLICTLSLISLAACSTGSTGSTSSSGAGGSTGASSSSSGSGGSSGSSSATVNGTIAGRSFSPAYAVAAKGIDDHAYPNQVTVFITNNGAFCGLIKAAIAHPTNNGTANLLEMGFVLGETDPDAGAVTPGTYASSSNPDELTAAYNVQDANCVSTTGEETAGSVIVTAVGAVYSGTFDLTFAADHVTGTFAAPLCDTSMVVAGTPGDAGSVCEP